VLSKVPTYIRFELNKLQSSAVDLNDLRGLGRLGVLIGDRTGLDGRVRFPLLVVKLTSSEMVRIAWSLPCNSYISRRSWPRLWSLIARSSHDDSHRPNSRVSLDMTCIGL
jgi:hypothetical protein